MSLDIPELANMLLLSLRSSEVADDIGPLHMTVHRAICWWLSRRQKSRLIREQGRLGKCHVLATV